MQIAIAILIRDVDARQSQGSAEADTLNDTANDALTDTSGVAITDTAGA